MDNEELQIERTPKALYKFVASKFDELKNSEERKVARKKKHNYKEFIEELFPLSIFVANRYSEQFQCRPVLGNQGYDAEILFNNEVVERVEIGWYIDGYTENKIADELNQNGASEVRLVDHIDKNMKIQNLIKLAEKKSKIDYSECQLVLVLDRDNYFSMNERTEDDAINHLLIEFQKIKFNAMNVFLLSMETMKVIKVV